MKHFRYHMNPETEQPHIYDHGVTEEEVEELFQNFPETMRAKKSPEHRTRTWMALGQTFAGRYLKVFYLPDEDGRGNFVITAYDLDGDDLRAHRRRMKRRYR
jgi:hypothetical protein